MRTDAIPSGVEHDLRNSSASQGVKFKKRKSKVIGRVSKKKNKYRHILVKRVLSLKTMIRLLK
jgi:hypothetical protein